MFHFLGDNLKDTWKRHRDNASRKGTAADDTSGSALSVFQYGDWFQKFPNGVPETDYERPVEKVKEESIDEAGLSHKSDLQRVEDFFEQMSPPTRPPPPNAKPKRKQSKPTAVQTKLHPPQVLPQEASLGMPVQSMASLPPQTPMVPSPFSPHPSQPLYSTLPPQTYDLRCQAPDSALLPYLDRNLVYDAYSQTSGPSIPSVESSFQPLSMGDQTASMWEHAMGDLNAPTQALGPMGSYMGGFQQSSAWFMPFNLPPPTGLAYPSEANTGNGMAGVGGDEGR